MPTLPIDALPELLAPRGYVPAAAPLPLAAEPLFALPLIHPPAPGGLTASGDTLGRVLASAVAARAAMRWSDAARIAILGAAAAREAGEHAWEQRFANEAAAVSLLSGAPAPEELDERGDPSLAAPDADLHADVPPAERARALLNRAVAAALAGEGDAADRHLAAAERALGGGDAFGRLLVLVNRAQLLLDDGDVDAAAEQAAAALRLSRREREDYWTALAGVSVALASLARGRRNAARTHLSDAARLFARFGDALRQVQCHYLLGEVAYMGEDPIRAGSHYRDALAIARPAEAQEWIELLTLRFEHR
jgi:tetratricopeptide (TPR) repeat protein